MIDQKSRIVIPSSNLSSYSSGILCDDNLHVRLHASGKAEAERRAQVICKQLAMQVQQQIEREDRT